MVRHLGTWVSDLKAEFVAGTVTRIVRPAVIVLGSDMADALEYYEAIALLISSGVLQAPATGGLLSYSLPEFHPDACQFTIPADLQFPVANAPMSWEVVPFSSVPGKWRSTSFEAGDALRLSYAVVSVRASYAALAAARPSASATQRKLAAGPRVMAGVALAQSQSQCGAGMYANPDSVCTPCTQCAADSIATSQCTATSDTVCKTIALVCGAGAYYNGTGCAQCSVCGTTQAQVTPCNITSDVTCTGAHACVRMCVRVCAFV